MDVNLQKQLIQTGRDFMKADRTDELYPDYKTDQQLQLPQPPLTKAPMRGEDARTALPRNFEDLQLKNDLLALLRDRHSSRVYTGESMSLLQLSFLLWATQGIKSVRGKSYATLRTVPAGGARHAFETYLVVRNVEGLVPGAYHYLPFEHALEYLHAVENDSETITRSLCGQAWGGKANVVFYWSMVAYRCEWRYGISAHRPALMDIGHVGENLYLACTGAGLGTCGVAAFSHDLCCELFELDGNDEYPVYTMPVGTVREEDKQAEQAFYSFVTEQGL